MGVAAQLNGPTDEVAARIEDWTSDTLPLDGPGFIEAGHDGRRSVCSRHAARPQGSRSLVIERLERTEIRGAGYSVEAHERTMVA